LFAVDEAGEGEVAVGQARGLGEVAVTLELRVADAVAVAVSAAFEVGLGVDDQPAAPR
jgi:hypothetical protein